MSTETDVSILFVDDEKPVVAALRRVFADEPYEVRTCTDPHVALSEITANAPTVVVADYYMPGMQGPALLKRVREIDDGIIRVILTGKPDVTAVLDAVKNGAVYRFILKPWDDDDLRMTIRQAVDYARLLGERNALRRALARQRETIDSLEEVHPGISRLPEQDVRGAFVLSARDLPPGGEGG